MKKRLLSVLLCVAILATVTPLFAAAESARYLAYNSSTGLVDAEREVTDVNVIDEATDAFVTGWNIVKGDVVFGDRIVLPEDVNLILADNATLTADKGITVAADGDFAIYAQSNDAAMGKLVVPEGLESFDAGISGAYTQRCGDISIYGGTVTVQGGEGAVAIGAASVGQCGNISIYGGNVTAQGGAFSSAIGSSQDGVCGDITIFDGKVNAQGGLDGAGIGSGSSGSCGDITIFGDTVTAQGGDYGAGIGSGSSGSCGDITILGGTVTAQGGLDGAGIGSGNCIDPRTGVASSCRNVTITSGIVFAQGGRLAPGIGCYTRSDVEMASCGKMTITGGNIKATADKGTTVFIGVAGNPEAGEVSIDRSCTSAIYNNSQYINYKIPAVEVTCTENGTLEYYIEPISGNYYAALPLTEDTLIGDEEALAAWKAKGGAGYVATLPHTDENEDDICDVCESVLTAYLDYNATTGKVDTERKIVVDNVIDEATDSFVTGWNVVKGDVEFESRIVLPKDVNLILANGATLTADKGIQVAADGDFAVYAQSNDAATMGELIALNEDHLCAGIGGGFMNTICGNVTISGGVVNAQGGQGAAGIGGGYDSACDGVTIYGGIVHAQGGENGAGIGSGYSGSSCGNITISGGMVTAQGGCESAGIGSGFCGSCENITISGGYVKATPGEDAAAIGKGFAASVGEVSIADSCTSVIKDGAQYINYEPFAVVWPTCTVCGTKAHVKDSISGNYYTAFPFMEDELIGDADAFAVWKAQGGKGYMEPLGHDWKLVDETTHKCTRCDATGTHTDGDKCDICHVVAVPYLDYNATTGAVDTKRFLWMAHVIQNEGDTFVTGWNVVRGDVVFNDRITLPKDVNLVLEDGATLIARKGISVAEDGSFAVYAQSNDATMMGKLIVLSTEDHNAGIGSLDYSSCGDIAIYGGNVVVMGGYFSAGIGSGYHGACGDITIRGGTVATLGGDFVVAGIGSGKNASCGNITISGGTVTVRCGGFSAGIGSSEGGVCGDITISGGTVTAQGGQEAAGIGSGYDGSSCGDITISGGTVTAWGGKDGAGIGSGYDGSSCGYVIITGGHVKATAGGRYAEPIGAGRLPRCDILLIDDSCTVATDGNSMYINYKVLAVEPTCTESGVPEYFKDYVSDNYYTALPFTSDTLIGDADAFAAWKAEGGEGYVAPLGHDWQPVDEDTHKCSRCEVTKAHTDTDEDYICDDCGYVLLAASKADAIAALNEAAGENPSDGVSKIVSDAADTVSSAKTLEEVATEKENGLAAIDEQQKAEAAQMLADAKTAAKAALVEAAGANPSAAVQASLDTACKTIDDANSPESVTAVKAAAFSMITAQVAAAKAAAEKQALEEELAQAQKDLSAANEAIAALNDTVASKEATIAEKQAAVEAAQKALDEAQVKVTELEGAVSEQDEALKQAEKEIQDLQAEIERLKALLDDDPTDPTEKLLGDANNDGAVNMKDVLLMRKFLAGLDMEYNAENADCNGDGDVNMKDVLMLRKYLAGLITELGA